MIVPVLLPMSDPLIVSIGIAEGILCELDRSTRARANGYATIYAMKAHPLWEIDEDIETATPLTLPERLGFAMMLSGDRKSTRLNYSHSCASRLPSSASKKKATI